MGVFINILPWILPPVIGAAIGYITNAIAITMLFRPHKEKRLLSIRIPMTPGIIPKQRYELSESVGKMVSRELLTEDAVRKQIRSKSFLESLDSSIKMFIDLLIETPVINLKEKFIRSRLKIKTEDKITKSFLPELLAGFLDSEGFSNVIEGLLEKAILYIEDKTPNQLFPDRQERVVGKVTAAIVSPDLENKLLKIVEKWLQKAIHDNYHLSVILTSNNIERFINISSKLYKRLFPHFIHFLKTDEVKNELEVHGRRLLEDIINKLNKIQRFLISAGQYDKTLDENMMGIVEDTIMNMKDYGEEEKNIKNMSEGLKRRLFSLSQASAGQIVSDWDGDLFEDLQNLVNSFFEFIRNPIILENLSSWFNSIYESYSDNTMKSFISEWFNLSFSDLKNIILKFIFKDREGGYGAKSGDFTISLLSGIFDVVTGKGELSVGQIINITPEIKTRISTSLTSTLIGIVDDKVPQILESIDVNTLVVDKIDTLNMEKVEKLILDIVKKQLRWINVFGAVLGSIIGGAQLLINMFM
jgi:uncharacterized membrane protein YheB (UPF0754 family)